MQNDYQNALNSRQLEAIDQPLVPILVIAGPGTGKTRVLTYRIVELISKFKIQPHKILALTFTNKAAAEINSRLVNLIGDYGREVNATTFHSFALQLLRKYHKKVGLEKYFSVCDQDYQIHLVRNISSPFIHENLDMKVRAILLSFSNYLLRNKSLSDFTLKLFNNYKQYLQKHNLVDFDQIILFCRNLLHNNQDIVEEYKFLYPAVLVDEFQDTDAMQYDILKKITGSSSNVFVVADDDQSIYSWRGANPENVNKFQNDFHIKDPIFLEVNYRSGTNIMDSASRIIKKTKRLQPNKNLKVRTENKDNVQLKVFTNEKDEINFLDKQIKTWITAGSRYKDIAIIYPFHKIGQSLEQLFINKEIPYQMADGRSLFNHPVMRKIILFLKLVRNVDDNIALEELTGTILGEALYRKIKEHTNRQKYTFRQSLYNFYRDQDHNLDFDTKMKVKKFVTHIANLVNLKNFYNFNQFINEIVSVNEQQTYSFLIRNLKNLNPIEEIFPYETLNLIKGNVFVHHPDRGISFLATELLTPIINKKCKDRLPNDKEAAHSDNILIEFESTGDKYLKMHKVPLYLLKNNLHQGSLSVLFKFLQGYVSAIGRKNINRYVVLDLETTDKDVNSCDIVEFAAVRIVEKQVTEKISTLIKPRKRISEGAKNVHHISEKDVANSPSIEYFWPKLKEFIGNDLLIAHNGINFDFIILDRFAKQIEGEKLGNSRLDTLTMARNIFPNEQNSIDALIDRYKLETNTRHRALDDVLVLVDIFEQLRRHQAKILKLTSLEFYLDIVALGNFIEHRINIGEDQIFFIGGARKLLTAYSKIFFKYVKKFEVGNEELRKRINEKLSILEAHVHWYQDDENIMSKIKEMALLYDKLPIEEAIANFLSRISMERAQDQLDDLDAVSLLTYHAVKGLEFDKVILIGLEKNNMPGFHALRDDTDDDRPVAQKVEEQRRLFYVGMTRAKSELILTAVKNRGGWEYESSPFLKDLDLENILK